MTTMNWNEWLRKNWNEQTILWSYKQSRMCSYQKTKWILKKWSKMCFYAWTKTMMRYWIIITFVMILLTSLSNYLIIIFFTSRQNCSSSIKNTWRLRSSFFRISYYEFTFAIVNIVFIFHWRLILHIMFERKCFNRERKFNFVRRKVNHKANCHIRIKRKQIITFLKNILTSSNIH